MLSARIPLVIDTAEEQGLLFPHTGSMVFEGTVGSTGISIATVAKARCVCSPYPPLLHNELLHQANWIRL